MSKGFNKILDFMKLNDNEYEADYDEYDDEIEDDMEDDYVEEQPKKKKGASRVFSSRMKKASGQTTARQNDDYDEYDDYDDLEDEEPAPARSSRSGFSGRKQSSYSRSSKIVPMRSSGTARGMEVCVSKPIDFNTCQEISDIILSGRAAVINFDSVTTQEAQRIIDFVSGSCYAINGSAKQISDTIVVVTPENIDITGDLQEMASSNVDVPDFGYSEED